MTLGAMIQAVWNVLGPLAGVVLGAFLTWHWQRKQWFLDNKKAEYRGLLAALGAYEWSLARYASVRVASGGPNRVSDGWDERCLEAENSLRNAMATAIFFRNALESSGISNDVKIFMERANEIMKPSAKIEPSSVTGIFTDIKKLRDRIVSIADSQLGTK